MAVERYHHIERRGTQWAVRAQGSTRDARVFQTRQEAVEFARQLDYPGEEKLVFPGLRERSRAFSVAACLPYPPVFDVEAIALQVFCTIALQAFGDDAVRFCEVVGLSGEELGRVWLCEEVAAETARLLRDLSVVVAELLTVYEPEAVPEWLQGRAPGELKTPMEWLREGNLAEVLSQINASATGAYS
jgi:hypothetical protein